MKVAELKRRLTVGTKLILVNNLMGPCRKERVVAQVNTVGVGLMGPDLPAGRLSYFDWPKKMSLVETANGFMIRHDNQVAIQYEWADRTDLSLKGS